VVADLERERERIREAARIIRSAERPVRVLRSIAWRAEVREQFLRDRAERFPAVTYPRFDPRPVSEALDAARRLLHGDSVIDAWLSRVADAVDSGARMMATAGTADFFRVSRSLYGAPTDRLPDDLNTPLGLAQMLDEVLAKLGREELGAPGESCYLASELAGTMRDAVKRKLGDEGPEIEVVDELSANVVAGPHRIRIRRQACFTDRDLHQLVEHEVLVHVATSLNGQAQMHLPILSAAHPGTTRTQEGLAVFAEFITGTIDPSRFRRLAERVLAIQCAIEGADFIEGYRFFLERGVEPEQAFENARRVYRGGVLTGGAPFTKDVVYLDGLLRVHNFLRVAVTMDRVDCIPLLFCGKIDLEDLPALCELVTLGLCQPARFMPDWATDLRQLVAYLAYSSFANRVDLDAVREHYRSLLRRSPTTQAG
jgi:uncharacterized protein (TIGR02421 family)